jgi:hypothetical protein
VKINLKDATIKMMVMDGVQLKCIFLEAMLGNSFGKNLFQIYLQS